MSPDSIPQISLGTAALIIFAACAAYVMLRGITRMIVGSLVLGLSAWIGYFVWQEAPALSMQLLGRSAGWLTTGLPVAAFLVSFGVIRWIAKAVARPFGEKPADGRKSGSLAGRLVFRLLLALIPTAILGIIGVTLIHHTGSIAEIRASAEGGNGHSEPAPAHFSQRLKSSIEAALPESWLRKLDPLADPARIALVKEITAHTATPRAPVIDPATGQPIPRAIIVDDPELQNLAREGKFGTLLRHPLLTKVLNDPKLQPAANNPNP